MLLLLQGNQIVTVPAFDSGRYWIVPFLDAYTNFYSSIGSHNNSTAGDYLVLGRGKLQAHRQTADRLTFV